MIDLEQLERDVAKLRVPVRAGDELIDWQAAMRLVNAVPVLLRAARGLERCCEETDYCYACDCHPSHGHAADCPLR